MKLPNTDIRVHRLKTIQPHFDQVCTGEKTFELRKNDRRYCVGDWLLLVEYIPAKDEVTERAVLVQVTHILYGPVYGLAADYVILSIQPVTDCDKDDLHM